MLTQVGSSSAPVFNELVSLGLFGEGLVIGGLIVYALLMWLSHGVSSVIHGRQTQKYD